MSMLPSVGPAMGTQNLAPRLDALAELLRIGRARQGQGILAETHAPGQNDGTGFSNSLLDDAEAVLKRAGERLRLSGNHTVVALAGGTGSGKSTLFNALSGATFSPPGVTRPMTRHVHRVGDAGGRAAARLARGAAPPPVRQGQRPRLR